MSDQRRHLSFVPCHLSLTGKPRTKDQGPSSGFTLIELLAVVTILGLLMGLLLPALQGSRESSRRATCSNHLKQIGLALTNYESARHALPMGVHGNPSFGLSFWPFIMPYMEYSSAVEKLDMYNPATGAMTANMLVDGILVEPLICPSSPFVPLYPYLGVQVTMPHYTGIAGATALDDGFPETRVTACCVPDHFVGQISGGGVLVPNQCIRFEQITDGLSKTLVVAECSDYAMNSNPAGQIRVDAGVDIGWLGGTYEQGTPPNYGTKNTTSSPRQPWNITTIRYAPNMRDYLKPGVRRNGGANNPLLSAHPGGVGGVMMDGSVHMLSDGIDVWLLKQLATRDDGLIGSQVP